MSRSRKRGLCKTGSERDREHHVGEAALSCWAELKLKIRTFLWEAEEGREVRKGGRECGRKEEE